MGNPEHTIKNNRDGNRAAAERRYVERGMEETLKSMPAVKKTTPAPWELVDTAPKKGERQSYTLWHDDGTEDGRVVAGLEGVLPADAKILAASAEMLAQLKHCYAMAVKLGDDKWAAEIKATIVKAIGDVSW